MNDLNTQQSLPADDEPSVAQPENSQAQVAEPGAQTPPEAAEQASAQEDAEQEAASQGHSWSSLPAEHEQLIRLAPLAADRETGLRPLLFGAFCQVEKHSKSQSMLKLSINFPGHKPGKGVNVLEVWADHASQEVYILPEHGLRTEPANRGLGRFMLAMAARWARKKFSGYNLRSIAMQVKHVPNDAARLRRDHALQAQGFTVAYEDGVQMRASCNTTKVREISTDWNQDKVRLIDSCEVADILQKADKSLKEQERELRNLHEEVTYLKKDDNTLRFTITMLVVFAIFQAVLLIWMATK